MALRIVWYLKGHEDMVCTSLMEVHLVWVETTLHNLSWEIWTLPNYMEVAVENVFARYVKVEGTWIGWRKELEICRLVPLRLNWKGSQRTIERLPQLELENLDSTELHGRGSGEHIDRKSVV